MRRQPAEDEGEAVGFVRGFPCELRQGKKRRILFLARGVVSLNGPISFSRTGPLVSPERAHIQHTPSFFSIPPLLFCRLCSFFFLCEGPEHGDWPFRFPILYSFWCWYSVYLNGSFIKNFISINFCITSSILLIWQDNCAMKLLLRLALGYTNCQLGIILCSLISFFK